MMLEGTVKRMVKVERSNGMLAVACPFSKSFVSFAKMRGGKWSDGTKQWMFDERDEFAIRSTLIDIYGTDDYESCEKTDVRIELDNMWSLVKNKGRLFFLTPQLHISALCAVSLPTTARSTKSSHTPLTAHTLCCSIYLGTEHIVRSEVELWIAVD